MREEGGGTGARDRRTDSGARKRKRSVENVHIWMEELLERKKIIHNCHPFLEPIVFYLELFKGKVLRSSRKTT